MAKSHGFCQVADGSCDFVTCITSLEGGGDASLTAAARGVVGKRIAGEQAESFTQGLLERDDDAEFFKVWGLRPRAEGGAMEHRI